jgi:decaprenyl-phosphate phosphoribosyltransferase
VSTLLAKSQARPTFSGRTRALLSATRPRQWAKNLLVFGAPAAAGALAIPGVLADATLAFVAFTLAASGTYLINDTVDAPADRLHPTKRHRPVASGQLSGRAAVAFGAVAIGLSFVPALLIGRGAFTATLISYVVLTLSYTLWLKRYAVVDLVVVASGFGLRAVGGAFSIAVPISRWFLIVTFFGALFVVAGKRFGEQQRLGADAGTHRETLSVYADFYTQHVMTLSSGITLVGYGLWAHDHGYLSAWWFLASFMFLVMVLLRFALLVHAGASDDPVEIAWDDRPLRVLTILFLALVVGGIQLG